MSSIDLVFKWLLLCVLALAPCIEIGTVTLNWTINTACVITIGRMGS